VANESHKLLSKVKENVAKKNRKIYFRKVQSQEKCAKG